MSRRALVAGFAALAAALACGAEPPSQPSVLAAAPGQPEAVAAEPTPAASAPPVEATAERPPTPGPAVPAPPTAAAAARGAGAETVPLERLLALPPYRKPDTPDLAELLRRDAAAAPAAPSAHASRLRFDLHRRTDAPVEGSDLEREQVDAGVAVSVGEGTSVRGGVRVERDTAEAVDSSLDTTPSIGIEKRF